MESQPGATTMGTSFYQHQFFPAGDLSDPSDAKWDKCSRYVDSERSDWDVKAWNWDSLLFLAQPSSEPEQPKTLPDAADEDDSECLTLKLGARTYSSTEDSNRNGKRQRSSSPVHQTQSQPQPQQQQYPMCQVDDCKADLSSAKDYHRRHKVCEMHSKAAKASVARLMQRFCQQCSRFHPLQEFDEGKRSCRRRLAGHNRRRRKTQPEAAASQAFLLGDEDLAAKSAGLLRLLQVLSQLQAASTLDKVTAVPERDIALEHLRRAMSVSSALGTKVESSSNNGYTSQKPEFQLSSLPLDTQLLSALSGVPLLEALSLLLQNTLKGQATAPQTGGRTPDYMQAHAPPATSRPAHSVIEVDGPPVHKLFPMQAASVANNVGEHASPSLLTLLGAREAPASPPAPPPTSNNVQAGHSQQSSESLSGSDQSPESSYADWQVQERTGRISFKLFDRNPGDFPQLLRNQILEWLSHVPSEMESYIRPGCVVLSIFLSMPVSAWKRLYNDLLGNLKRLIDSSSTGFWSKGRILVQVCDQSAYVVDGKVQAVSFKSRNVPQILEVRPLAAVRGEETTFVMKGFDLTGQDTRVLCAYQGKYELQAWTKNEEDANSGKASLSFTLGPCNSIGRCFIEVERDGGSGFVPVLVVDDVICEEVRTLEDELTTASRRAARFAKACGIPEEYVEEFIKSIWDAVEHELGRFLHDLGWLLQKRHWQSINKQEHFSLESATVKRLLLFAVEREWCAVVKTLLDTIFEFQVAPEVVQSVNLLHRAAVRKSLPMVEFLLSYRLSELNMFSPDAIGPAGLTPLHIAACLKGADQIVSALTSSQVGLQAWNNVRDVQGQSPFDCALSNGNFTYIQLVWSRIATSKGKSVLPSTLQLQQPLEQCLELPKWTPSSSSPSKPKQLLTCRGCNRQVAGIRGPMYRPFMLSMVAVAAVCVCVCLYFKSRADVPFPFTWDSVEFGPK